MTLHLIDNLVILSYLIVLLLIGLFMRNAKKTGHDLFLGGKTFKWPLIGFTLFATNVSPMMLVSYAGLAYTTGIVGANFEWLAWPFLILLSMVFLPYYFAGKVTTMPEFMMQRYGKRAYSFLTGYTLFSILVIWLGGSLYAGGIIVSQILNIPLWVAMVVTVVIATSYTAVGGLAAIIKTDVFQSVVIILGSAVLVVLALLKIGSIDNLVQGVPSHFWHLFRSSSDDYPWYAILLGYPVVGVYYFCTDQNIVQKVLAAKSIEEGQRGSIFLVVLKIFTPMLFLFPGILCLVLYPDLANSDRAYITMVTNILPTGLVGLLIAGLSAALINAIATALNSFSTVFTLDVYKRAINPTADAVKLKHIGQIITIVAAILAVFIGFSFSLIGKNLFNITQGIAGFIAPPLTVVFLLGVLWRRATRFSADLTMYGGGALCLIISFLYFLKIPSEAFWPHFMLLSFYLCIGLMAFMIIVSLMSKPDENSNVQTLREVNKASGIKTNKKIWLLWTVLAVIMISLYIIFK